MSVPRRVFRLLCILLAPVFLFGSVLIANRPAQVGASSHREAPLIASDPDADTTDVYAFVSPDAPSTVTLIGNWIPLEWPEGGPNYHKFSDDVLYEIHVDNVGDGVNHITYQFRFKTTTRNPNTFLYNVGPISSLSDPNWNVTQSYTVTEIINGVSTVIGSHLPTPPVNIGSKSTPNYEALANTAISTLTVGGDTFKVFAGQRDDPFFVDLGSVFDLLSLRGQGPPIGYASGRSPGLDGLSGYNTHSIAIQVPISRLLDSAPSGETVIGVWATSSRQTTRVLGAYGLPTNTGSFVQISRLGMPLVNEVVIPRALKDVFNGLAPKDDQATYIATPLLQESVQDPELGNLLCSLYNVPLPRDTGGDCDTDYTTPATGRSDLFDIFLFGIKLGAPFTIKTAAQGDVQLPAGTNVNQFTKSPSIKAAEMIRLNTAFRPGQLCSPTPNYQLGLLGGDACGFPNGRRLQDDVTDIELLAVAGAAWQVTTGDTSFTFNNALVPVLTDSVSANDKAFSTTFPYLAAPHQGQEHYHESLNRLYVPNVNKAGSGLNKLLKYRADTIATEHAGALHLASLCRGIKQAYLDHCAD